jgi:hypothetical protein
VRGSAVKKKARAKKWMISVVVVLLLGLAGLVGAAGCGEEESPPTTAAGVWRQEGEEAAGTAMAVAEDAVYAPEASATVGHGQAVGDTLGALEAVADRKIIARAQLDIEVEPGEFQNVFRKALLLADQYGGYILSSSSYASGEEGTIKSGTVVVRIPAGSSFDRALNEASDFGELKGRSVDSDDVTSEYVDIQSDIRHTQAVVDEILGLLAKAKTIDEILRIQQTLAPWQQQLEQLIGRLRYLDEHTSYSTLTLNIYEAGAEVTPPSEWGFVEALKDALHHLVDAFSAIVRGLGWLIPILVIAGVVVYLIYLIFRAATRRNRARTETPHPTYEPQKDSGSGGPAAQGSQAREPGAQPGAGVGKKDQKDKIS